MGALSYSARAQYTAGDCIQIVQTDSTSTIVVVDTCRHVRDTIRVRNRAQSAIGESFVFDYDSCISITVHKGRISYETVWTTIPADTIWWTPEDTVFIPARQVSSKVRHVLPDTIRWVNRCADPCVAPRSIPIYYEEQVKSETYTNVTVCDTICYRGVYHDEDSSSTRFTANEYYHIRLRMKNSLYPDWGRVIYLRRGADSSATMNNLDPTNGSPHPMPAGMDSLREGSFLWAAQFLGISGTIYTGKVRRINWFPMLCGAVPDMALPADTFQTIIMNCRKEQRPTWEIRTRDVYWKDTVLNVDTCGCIKVRFTATGTWETVTETIHYTETVHRPIIEQEPYDCTPMAWYEEREIVMEPYQEYTDLVTDWGVKYEQRNLASWQELLSRSQVDCTDPNARIVCWTTYHNPGGQDSVVVTINTARNAATYPSDSCACIDTTSSDWRQMMEESYRWEVQSYSDLKWKCDWYWRVVRRFQAPACSTIVTKTDTCEFDGRTYTISYPMPRAGCPTETCYRDVIVGWEDVEVDKETTLVYKKLNVTGVTPHFTDTCRCVPVIVAGGQARPWCDTLHIVSACPEEEVRWVGNVLVIPCSGSSTHDANPRLRCEYVTLDPTGDWAEPEASGDELVSIVYDGSDEVPLGGILSWRSSEGRLAIHGDAERRVRICWWTNP